MAGLQSAPGGSQMMNDPTAFAGGSNLSVSNDGKNLLNTYIYDYFIRNRQPEIAEAMIKNRQGLALEVKSVPRTSPNGRAINGVDDKDDRLKNLPVANIPNAEFESCFLADWWAQFWDIWSAAQQRDKSAVPSSAQNYFQHQQRQAQARQATNQMLVQQSGTMAGTMGLMVRNFQNGVQNGMQNGMQIHKQAIHNSRNMNPQQQYGMQNIRQQQQMAQMQMQMQRDGSDMDVNGQPRPQSPMSGGDSAPSPKRQRLEPGSFSGPQMIPGNRIASMGGQMPNGAAQNAGMMIQNGIDQTANLPFLNNPGGNPDLTIYKQDLASNQRTAMNELSGVPKGIGNPGNMPPTGSPMLAPDGQMMPDGAFYSPQQANPIQRGMAAANGNPPGGGGGALADYQMQLMLLEQQNKKRLMMARQEQGVATRDGNNNPPQLGPNGQLMGQPQFTATGMSPRNSRTGHSPNAADQMKRGTPKTGQNSPLPDGSIPIPGASPAPGFDPNMPPNLAHQFMGSIAKMGGDAMMGPNGNMMRPPSSNPVFSGAMNPQQMDLYRQQQQAQPGRMPSMNWTQGQMPNQMMHQNQMGQQPPPDAQPLQRNPMPPPQAPAMNNTNGRTNPPSPQAQQAPPTPSATNKPNPKKKDTKDSKKKATKKGGPPAATPSSEAEQPPTPTPATPITPVHPNSFTAKGMAAQQQPQNGSQQTQAGPVTGNLALPGQQDPGMGGAPPFGGSLDGSNEMPYSGIDLGFGDPMGGVDALEGFDFDSFLQIDQDNGDFGGGFDTSQYTGVSGEGVETGADA